MVDSSLTKGGDVPSPDAKHVEIKNGDGPRASKPRPTWKRLARMLCGSDVSKQHDVIVLGREMCRKMKIKQVWIQRQLKKREKVEERSQKTTVVGVMNHPCQAK